MLVIGHAFIIVLVVAVDGLGEARQRRRGTSLLHVSEQLLRLRLLASAVLLVGLRSFAAIASLQCNFNVLGASPRVSEAAIQSATSVTLLQSGNRLRNNM